MIKLKAESGQCVPQITQLVRQTYLPGSSITSHWVVLAYISEQFHSLVARWLCHTNFVRIFIIKYELVKTVVDG